MLLCTGATARARLRRHGAGAAAAGPWPQGGHPAIFKDGSSGEIEMLRRCGAVVYACPNAKFTWLMTDAERTEARRTNTRTLQTILQSSFDLLVLDEACAACKNDLVEEALLREAAARAEQGAEVVLTGREPPPGCRTPPTTPPSCAPSSTPTPGHRRARGC